MENGGRGGSDPMGSGRDEPGIAVGLQDRIEGVRGYAEDAGAWIEKFARERPMLAIAAAAGLGFVLGRLASRT
ncbi:MAG TPA: hypothetical protein VD838_22255 [Anaeromyxobacteraceae bacterium]|nr:hypothetical protein [Anaeromyxobacteraceae bacterium]